MLAAIKILLWVYIYNGSTTLEHPKGESEDSDIWSIWRSSFLRQWQQAADVDVVTFLQGPLGRPFHKPTSILAARLPGLAQYIFSQYDLSWKPTERWEGKLAPNGAQLGPRFIQRNFAKHWLFVIWIAQQMLNVKEMRTFLSTCIP